MFSVRISDELSPAMVHGNLYVDAAMGPLRADMTSDGRFVVFEEGFDFVPGDVNLVPDIVRREVMTGEVEIVSLTSVGGPSNGGHLTNGARPAVSDDGSLVVFQSKATNLVPGGEPGVYLRNIAAGTTTRVDPPGCNGRLPDISANGAFLVFTTTCALVANDLNGVDDVYRLRLSDGAFQLVSIALNAKAGNGSSTGGRISADGSIVVYRSMATNLVSGDTNGQTDIFARDFTKVITVSKRVAAGPHELSDFAVSANGRYVALEVEQANVGRIDRIDLVSGVSVTASISKGGSVIEAAAPSLSADGRYVTFTAAHDSPVDPADDDGLTDAVVRDMILLTTTRVGVRDDGTNVAGSIAGPVSATGRSVLFASADPTASMLGNVPQGPGNFWNPWDLYVTFRR